MDINLWISFVGAVLILTLTPGPSVLLATANSMKYGVKKTSGTIIGDLTANLLQIILASGGLGAILITSKELFMLLKWLGVFYLVYAGIGKIIDKPKQGQNKRFAQNRSFFSLFTEGFLMSISNPKAIAFFAALFPLFISQSKPFLAQVFILTITFLILDGLSLLGYTYFATKLKGFMENSKKVHLQNKIAGSLLILSGLMLSMIKRTNG
ncbi:LysE family translocator [Flagellimonas olearia]|uniref:LysE family translocator n=1 Tax=Flagellimonas olearia TaxID=552546 RepID=A0A6I1E955_9FLAO|nr:LysE family transporter [Allomuricauda olearia]KAB7530244.1 LysE family translocator [Allomuricauda olearia]